MPGTTFHPSPSKCLGLRSRLLMPELAPLLAIKVRRNQYGSEGREQGHIEQEVLPGLSDSACGAWLSKGRVREYICCASANYAAGLVHARQTM